MHSTPSFRTIPLRLIFLNLLSFSGVGVGIGLTQHFYDVRQGVSGFKSFCNIAQTMNCDRVAASPFAEVFGGFPISSFAVGWFLTVFILSLIAYNPFWRRETVRACFLISGIGILISIPYFLIMKFQLQTYCLLCLVLDALSLASCMVAFALKPEGIKKHPLNPTQWKTMGGILASSLFLSVLGLTSLKGASIQAPDLTELVNSVLNSPTLSMQSEAGLPSIGPYEAPITVVEFSDFQCPYCKIGALALNSTMNRYPNKIRVIFRNFPLDHSCNSLSPQTVHPQACQAAKAALCAHEAGKFDLAYQELFENQTLLFSTGGLFKILQDAHLTENAAPKCLESSLTQASIDRDIEEAKRLGVTSTPTFFINGHKMEGAYPTSAWTILMDRLLNQ